MLSPSSTVDEILDWEKTKERETDVRFVELGRYPCEVRTRQYCRLEALKSFEGYLEKRFPDSRRKAYYFMAIHEANQGHVTPEGRIYGRSGKASDRPRD